jgi:hypothetical protein
MVWAMEQGSSAITNVQYFWEAKYSGCCVILYPEIDAELVSWRLVS